MEEGRIWSLGCGSRNWDPRSLDYIFLSNSLLITLAGLALLSEVVDLRQDNMTHLTNVKHDYMVLYSGPAMPAGIPLLHIIRSGPVWRGGGG